MEIRGTEISNVGNLGEALLSFDLLRKMSSDVVAREGRGGNLLSPRMP